MNRKLIYIIISLAIIGVLIFSYAIYSRNINKVEKIAEEEILDECTDEYEYLQKENLEKANATEEKVSPNCKITLKKVYNKCGHVKDEQVELPQELVNMSKEEVEEEYSDWTLEAFSENEIVLSKEFEEDCGEHYVLREEDGIIVIYKINEDGEEVFFDETEISTQYLTQTDLIEIQKGLRVNGLEELNKILEDYE